MKIQGMQYYMHLSRLVLVNGAKGMDKPETLRYMIHWTENGEKKHDYVSASELSPAPTLPELHDNYMLALNVISRQAGKIEDLEQQIEDLKSGKAMQS